MNPELKLFGIIAKPVLHSLSPLMYQAAFAASQTNAHYLRLSCESAAQGFKMAREIGLAAVNISAPFKSEAAALADRLEGAAQNLGAVNTVLFSKAGCFGYNTDVLGVENSFSRNAVNLQGKNALVLGAGPAGISAVHALLSAGAKVTLANRDLNKARQAAASLDIPVLGLGDHGFESLFPTFNIIVSCLSTPNKVISSHLLRSHMCLLDAWYASESCLARDARQAGAQVISGREWLAHQGQAAFRLFADKELDIEVFEKALESVKPEKSRNKIALIGFMGSGKSSVGSEIARLSSLRLIDLDREIERRSGKSIEQIFSDDGEEYFRQLESETLSILRDESNCVLACGGGTTLRAENRKILSEEFLTVWLWSDAAELLNRLGTDSNRPLLQGSRNIQDIRALLQKRLSTYAADCDLVVSSDDSDETTTALRIIDEVFSSH